MNPHAQLLTSYRFPSSVLIFPTTHFLKPSVSLSAPANGAFSIKQPLKVKRFGIECSVASVVSEPLHLELNRRPFPAEVSRTIVQLSSVGTLSTLTPDGSPLGFGVRFVVDFSGTPVLCLNDVDARFSADRRCSLHVQVRWLL